MNVQLDGGLGGVAGPVVRPAGVEPSLYATVQPSIGVDCTCVLLVLRSCSAGPVASFSSASPRVQCRLGWGRPRAVQPSSASSPSTTCTLLLDTLPYTRLTSLHTGRSGLYEGRHHHPHRELRLNRWLLRVPLHLAVVPTWCPPQI